MESLTRPALENAKTFIRDLAEAERLRDAGDELGFRRIIRRLSVSAEAEVAVIDAALAVLDEDALASWTPWGRLFRRPANDEPSSHSPLIA